MNTYTVSFFGHRVVGNSIDIANKVEQLVRTLLREQEYVEFLVGRDGDFDQIVSSTIRRCKRTVRDDNSALVWGLPYLTAEFRDNEESFRDYYDEIEVCEAAAGATTKMPTRPETGQWWTDRIWWYSASSMQAVAHGKL